MASSQSSVVSQNHPRYRVGSSIWKLGSRIFAEARTLVRAKQAQELDEWISGKPYGQASAWDSRNAAETQGSCPFVCFVNLVVKEKNWNHKTTRNDTKRHELMADGPAILVFDTSFLKLSKKRRKRRKPNRHKDYCRHLGWHKRGAGLAQPKG